jgi:transposase, IS5 family
LPEPHVAKPRPPTQEKVKQVYEKLLKATGRVVGQAKRFSQEINNGIKCCTDVVIQVALEGQRQILSERVPRLQQVMRRTIARIFEGDSRSERTDRLCNH